MRLFLNFTSFCLLLVLSAGSVGRALAEGYSEERLKCPLGAKQVGEPPPQGVLLYCARPTPGKSQLLRHGPFMTWYRSGEKKKEGGYLYGKLDGAQTEYYPNGQIKEKYNYTKGDLDGEHVAYFEDGTTEVKENYKLGKLNGKKEQNYRNGSARMIATYDHGSVQGVFALFHQSGKSRMQGFYNNRERSGTWTTFWEDGAKRLEGQYSAGKPDGMWNRYSRRGELLTETRFERGIMISRNKHKPTRETKKLAQNTTLLEAKTNKEFSKWNGRVRKSLRNQQKSRDASPEYIPRDEAKRLALERRKAAKEEKQQRKRVARDRELDKALENQKNPFYGVFSVGNKKPRVD